MKKLSKILLQILILLIPFYFIRFSIGPIPTTLLEVYIYAVFLFFLFSGNLKLRGKQKFILPAIVFLLFSWVGAVADPELMRGLGLWKGYFFDGFLVYLLFLSSDSFDDFTDIIFYSGALTGALALILFFSGVKSADGRLLDMDRLSPNYLAMFLAPIFVLGVFKSLKERTIVNYLSEAVIILALFLTYSRGALVAISGAVIMAIFYYIKRAKPKLAIISLILMLAAFCFGGYAVFKPDWSDHARKATSSNVRYYIWKTSLEIVKERPILGVGLGNFQDYFKNKTSTWVNYPEYISPEALTTHNLYLELYLTCGLLGLIGFFYLVISSKFYQFKSLAVSLAIFAILFYGLVDTPIFRNDLAIIFWILLSLSALASRKNA